MGRANMEKNYSKCEKMNTKANSSGLPSAGSVIPEAAEELPDYTTYTYNPSTAPWGGLSANFFQVNAQ